jgi:hypothetical protein
LEDAGARGTRLPVDIPLQRSGARGITVSRLATISQPQKTTFFIARPRAKTPHNRARCLLTETISAAPQADDFLSKSFIVPTGIIPFLNPLGIAG